MAAEFESISLYTDLDSLFDTRAATLLRIGGTALVEQAIAGGYFTRIADEFEGVDTEAFKAAYAKRDVYTLKEALLTSVIGLVSLFAGQTLTAVVNSPFRRQPEVAVNTYPYQLSDTEEIAIIAGLRAATSNNIDIRLIHLPPEALTPQMVKEKFAQVVMYDYVNWLETHATNGNWNKTQCPLVRLRAPALIKSNEAAQKLANIDVFEAIAKHSSFFITLEFCPAQTFSVNLGRMAKLQQNDASEA